MIKKTLLSTIAGFLFLLVLLFSPSHVHAQTSCNFDVTNVSVFSSSDLPDHLVADISADDIRIDGELITAEYDGQYYIEVQGSNCGLLGAPCRNVLARRELENGQYSDSLRVDEWGNLIFTDITKSYNVILARDNTPFPSTVICSGTVSYLGEDDDGGPPSPRCQDYLITDFAAIIPPNVTRGVPFTITIGGTDPILYNQTVYVRIYRVTEDAEIVEANLQTGISLDNRGVGQTTMVINEAVPNGNYQITITRGPDDPITNPCLAPKNIVIGGEVCLVPSEPCTPCPDPDGRPICAPYTCIEGCVAVEQISTFEDYCISVEGGINTCNTCERWPDGSVECNPTPPERQTICDYACSRVSTFDGYCADALGTAAGISTAIGCIPFTSAIEATRFFLAWGIGIAGGFAILLLIYGSLIVMTSSGNPDRINSGKSAIMAAISGIVMLVFAALLLRVIGVDILGLFS